MNRKPSPSRWSLRPFAVVVTLALVCAAWLLACHGDDAAPKQVPVSYAQVRELPGHVIHLGKTAKVDGVERVIECKDCHADVKKEGFVSPGAKPCGTCHAAQEKTHHHGSKEKPTACTVCHVFAPTDAGVSKTPICTDCHKAGEGKMASMPQHLGGNVACRACHAPHGEPRSVLAPCTACHQGINVVHGVGAVGVFPVAPQEATDHDAGDAGDAKAAVDALAAGDAGKADATTSLTEDAAKEAWKSAVPLSALNGDAGVEGPAICATCHLPHKGAKAAADGCATCHVTAPGAAAALGPSMAAIAAKAPKVDPAGAPAKHLCTTCHSPHAARKNQVTPCLTCHADHIGVTTVKSHGACLTCHAPHSPKGAAAACAKCHVGVQAFGANVIPKHAVCSSCHNVHTPTVTPAASCEKCHAGVMAKHPAVAAAPGTKAWKDAPPEKRVCIGCHKPHGKVDQKVALCSSCHQKIGPNVVASDTAFHKKMGCTNCHQKHTFHLAAQKPPSKGAMCRNCHETQAKAVAKGHDACLGCHVDQHMPTKNVACGGCHTKQASSAPKGHADCKACHDGHSGARIVRDGAGKASPAAAGNAFCAGCHANKSKAIHASLPTGCTTCHRPHGPNGVAAPPGCTTCHSKLPGLHTVKEHADKCANCHVTSHAPPSAQRETCTSSCHEKSKNHQPGAKVCNGCHVFRK